MKANEISNVNSRTTMLMRTIKIRNEIKARRITQKLVGINAESKECKFLLTCLLAYLFAVLICFSFLLDLFFVCLGKHSYIAI